MDLKSVPVLPSLITLGNLFFGFLAMAKVADAVWLGPVATPEVIAVFEVAVLLVLVAMVLDAMDGSVARMTGQTSAFGAQLDSLCDVVTFGVAPAFIAKVLINFHDGGGSIALLPAHPKIYYFCAAVYVLCTAMRLARYNVESGPDEDEGDEFKGLPSPGAAAVVCAMVAFVCSRGDTSNVITRSFLPDGVHDAVLMAMPGTLVCLGLLMVSRLPFPHAFGAVLRRRHSFPFLATLVILIGLAAIEWQVALLAITTCYALSGVLLGAYRFLRRGSMGPPSGGGGGVAAVPARTERSIAEVVERVTGPRSN